MITLAHFLVLGAVLLCVAVAGIFINRKKSSSCSCAWSCCFSR